MSTEDLGSRIKGYEHLSENSIPYDEFIIVRIDGHKFSKFTKGFNKPYDLSLSNTMEKTTKDLVKKFGAVTGYTQSDEITLIFPPQFKTKWIPVNNFSEIYENTIWENKETKEWGYVEIDEESSREDYSITYYIDDEKINDHVIYGAQGNDRKYYDDKTEILNKYNFYDESIINNQIFSGRTQKIASLISSYTTMVFNKHLETEIKKSLEIEEEHFSNSFRITPEEEEFLKKRSLLYSKIGEAWFDARVFGVPSAEEAYNVIMWRVRDAEKNSRSMFAQAYCSHSSLLNKNGVEQVKYCKETTGKDWELVEDRYKYGIFVKRESYLHTNGDNTATRTKIVSWSEKMTTFTEDSVKLIINKLKG